jgi:hypothetical protein
MAAQAMTAGEMERRAIQKALIRRDSAGFERVCLGTYRVSSASRPGAWHTVRVTADGRHACTCEAGLSRKPCWHSALTYVIRLEKNSGARVTSPTTRAPGEAAPSNVLAIRRAA